MKILITGGKGQLGQAFNRIAGLYPHHQIITYDVEEMDILCPTTVSRRIADHTPDVVVHAAAYTQVDKAEQDVDGAYRINVIGTQNVAAGCLKHNIKMVYVSTDYVFDGKKLEPYTEFDSVSPLSIYGKTKLAGEQIAAQICPRLFIARTAWLYGEGNNFVRTMLQLARQKEYVSVVNDQVGTPTYAVDLAQAILQLCATESYGIYHMTNQGSCTWYDFAREIFKQANINIEVKPVTTQEFLRPAPRPQHSILRNYMLELTIGDMFRPWQSALHEYLATEQENKAMSHH